MVWTWPLISSTKPATAVGRVTVPVKVGDANGALRAMLPTTLLNPMRIESAAATVPADAENPVNNFPFTVVEEIEAEADPGPLAVTSPVRAVI